MKNLVFKLCLVVLLVGGPNLAFAQMEEMKNSTPEERAQKQTRFMTENLSLNPGQTPQVEAINLKYAQKAQGIIDSGGGRMSTMKKFRSLQSDKDKELAEVLSAEQMKTYKAKKAEMRDKMRENRSNNRE